VREAPVIAIVDDDESFREALESSLERLHFAFAPLHPGRTLFSGASCGSSRAYCSAWRCRE